MLTNDIVSFEQLGPDVSYYGQVPLCPITGFDDDSLVFYVPFNSI